MAAQSVIAQHAEWLSLVEASGPFLSFEVLKKVFPQGLPKADDLRDKRERITAAYEEWLDNQGGLKPEQAIHRAWLEFVLHELLEWDAEVIREGQALPASLRVTVGEHGTTLSPTLAAVNPKGADAEDKPRVLVQLEQPGQGLEKVLEGARWKASPATRMMTLLHATDVRLGLITNGEHWMLVHAAPNETTTYVSFYANLFAGEEPLTLRALAALLDADALWGRGVEDATESLFARSKDDQFEVTDQLGSQVRRAVETLIQSIDRIDRDRGRQLLKDLPEERLYEAAVTVMMRLVFLLCAEERGLLLLGDPLYDQHYALSTLRDQLQEQADRNGKDVLARRHDAFSRLLATFRAVHGGVRHDHFHLPAYGGSLFDPDRFPFLEGREAETTYREVLAQPLPIDNLTVLDLLNSLTVLEVKLKGMKQAEARRLSFRELDVGQIGHVYEGLLDHTAKRAKSAVVSLQGKNEPEIAISELDTRLKKDGQDGLVSWLKEQTGRTPQALTKDLQYKIPKEDRSRWMMVCDNKPPLYASVSRWAGLVRKDAHERPVIFDEGAVYVTEGTDRRSTGTHYTPRSLTEPIVRYTLEPLVYEGPAEGKPKEEWKLKSAADLLKLKICDMAMGSGAFLVEVIRYMSARVVEAWEQAEEAADGQLVLTPAGELTQGDPRERAVPTDAEERLAIARRVVADRCVYGVDKNPMAVEMAKLSLWLVTLQKDKPFTFLDHALRCGDSLLGLTDEDQIRHFHIDPSRVANADGPLFRWGAGLGPALAKANTLRSALESFTVETLEDVREKGRLLGQAEKALGDLKLVADLVVGAVLVTASKGDGVLERTLVDLLPAVAKVIGRGDDRASRDMVVGTASSMLNGGVVEGEVGHRPFHWVLEFPEVFARGGFDAFVGNPPFMGGTVAAATLSVEYMRLVHVVFEGWHGKADLVGAFLRRAHALASRFSAVGILATSAIIRGETLDAALVPVLRGGRRMVFGLSPRPWPGAANVEVVGFALATHWKGRAVLDGQPVGGISDDMKAVEGDAHGTPYVIGGAPAAYLGAKISRKNAASPAGLSSEVNSLLSVLIGGEELYSLANVEDGPRILDPSRLLTASGALVELALTSVGASSVRELAHEAPAKAMFEALSTSRLAFACGETSFHDVFFRRIPCKGVIPKHKVIVFPNATWDLFGLLQSEVHRSWAWRWGLRREHRLVYSLLRRICG